MLPTSKQLKRIQTARPFKETSNMNYCLDFSLRVEDEMMRLMSEKENMKHTDPFMSPQEQNIEDSFEVVDDFTHTILEKDQGRS